MSLSSCLKKFGKNISPKDADAIRALVDDGMDPVDAVSNHIESLGVELAQAEATQLPPRATFNPETHLIALGKTSDLSSFLHESSHLFMEMERFYADKYGVTEDHQTILEWLGVESFNNVGVEQHEKWAETFETYLKEGKAPSLKLRDAFAAFGRWLARLYQELTDARLLRADLTPEITEVFNRMLATQAEIEAAMANPAYDVYFESMESAGMTEDQWTKYQRTQEKRKNRAQATLDEQLIKELVGRRTKEWDDERSEIAQNLEIEMRDLPIYKLKADLKNYKMDLQVLKDVMGVEKYPDLGLPPALAVKEGGIDPADYVEEHGFASIKDMVKQLQTTPGLATAAKEAAQAQMLDKYGDILNDGTIELEAQEAVHNDIQAGMLLQELRALKRKVGDKTTINRDYLKAEAKRLMAGSTYKQIKPNKFYRQEIKAAQGVVTATTDDERIQFKTQQLANHYMYREAVEVRKRMETHRKYAQGVKNRDYSKNKAVDKDTVGAMKMLVSVFDLRAQKPDRKAHMREVFDWYETQLNAGLEATLVMPEIMEAYALKSIPIDHQDPDNPRRWDDVLDDMPSFDDLTSEQLHGLYEMLRHMRSIGGKVAKHEADVRLAATSSLAESVRDRGGADKKGKRGRRRQREKIVRLWQRTVNTIPNLLNLCRKLDGDYTTGTGHAVTKIYRRVEDAASRKMTLTKGTFDLFNDELGDMFRMGINHKDKNRKEYVLENGNVLDLSSEERLMIVYYWGEESNRQAILQNIAGAGTGTENDVTNIMKDLTVDQLTVVNAMWRVGESQWDDYADVSRKMLGTVAPKLAAIPFVVNGVRMTGGYGRLYYDSQTIELKGIQEQASQQLNVAPGRAGSTFARVGSGGKPVLLDKNNIARQLEELTHYIAFAEVGEEIRMLLKSPDVTDAIETKHGQGFYTALIETIEGVTSNRPAKEPSEFLAAASRWARRTATARHLMFSLRNTIQQFASLPISMREVGAVRMATAMARFANPESRQMMVEMINRYSPFMADRASVVNKSAAAYLNQIQADNQFEHMWNEYAKYGFTPQIIVDRLFSYPTWLARFEEQMEDHGDHGRAVSAANASVVETVGSGADLHLGGAFQSNRPEMIKMFTQFGSWFNNYAQRVIKATEGGTKMDANVAVEVLMLPFTVAVISALFIMDEPKDDENWLLWAGKQYTGFMMGMVPVLREVAGTFSGFTPTVPLASTLEIPYKAGRAIIGTEKYFEGEVSGGKVLIDIAKVAAAAAPLPGSGTLIRVGEFMESSAQGKERGKQGLEKDLWWYQAIVEGKDRN